MLDKTPPDIPSSVVIRVEFLSTFQSLELVTITIILMCELTIRVATPLTRVRWLHYIHENPVIFGLVYGELLYRVERPLLGLPTFADVLQVLERNHRTVVTALARWLSRHGGGSLYSTERTVSRCSEY